MLKFTLRKKLLFFSVILALIPLGIAGRSMIRMTQDEVKSFLNDELIVTADQIAQDIDNFYTNTWLAPLLMMKRVVEDETLGSSEKMSILTNIRDVADIVCLQVSIEGTSSPILITQDKFTSRLSEAGITKTSELLLLTLGEIEAFQKTTTQSVSQSPAWEREGIFNGGPEYIPDVDSWLLSMIIPLKDISGRKATLSARINLDQIREKIENHPFSKNGNIMLVNTRGESIFSRTHTDLNDYEIVRLTKDLLNANIGTTGVSPYIRPSGQKMLAGYTFPSNFEWVVIVEKDALRAYLTVSKMMNSLLMMGIIGLLVAVAGAVIFSTRISRPILEISRVARHVGKGNFEVRVNERKSEDEISELGRQINEMVEGLRQRFELQKFVSDQTIDAIKRSDDGGIRLGGERKVATVLFSDIRGFTTFSEQHEPEVVINMLNTYLRRQAEIVSKHHGDIDKYVGDELVAVFQEKDMVRNAVSCAIKIHQAVKILNRENPEWGHIQVGIGINTGEMIMGAMGSEERMDYTILGDSVNLTARLCSHAGPGETFLSKNSYRHINNRKFLKTIHIVKEDPIQVKGKVERIQIYKVLGMKKRG